MQSLESSLQTVSQLREDRERNPRLQEAIGDLRKHFEGGEIRAAEELAELLSREGPYHDAECAYTCYYLIYSVGSMSSDWTFDFEDENEDPPYYLGKLTDFRNESMVSDLVVELGFEKVMELDERAKAWLLSHAS